MPRCKYCNEMLSNLDKDICPFCGGTKPLEGVSNETINITNVYKPIEDNEIPYKKKSSKNLIILAFILGFTGMPYFYLKNRKRGLICLLINVFLYITISLSLFLLIEALNNFLPFIIALLIPILTNVFLGFNIKKNRLSITDSSGETLS